MISFPWISSPTSSGKVKSMAVKATEKSSSGWNSEKNLNLNTSRNISFFSYQFHPRNVFCFRFLVLNVLCFVIDYFVLLLDVFRLTLSLSCFLIVYFAICCFS